MSVNVPYLNYLKNLKDNPNKYSAQKATPLRSVIVTDPRVMQAAVFQDSNEDAMRKLIEDVKIKESQKKAILEQPPSKEGPSNRALTDDEGNIVTLDQVESNGLMSPTSENDLGVKDPDEVFEEGNFKADPILGNFTDTIDALQKNTEFTTKLSTLTKKYGITEREILRVAAKESSLLTNPKAKNMFQILGIPASEAGIDLEKLNSSTNPVDHLNALEKYLDRWNFADYKGSVSLGLVIAAPGARNASSDYVVYKKGSDQLEANPDWAGPSGDATVESISNFYEVE